MPNLFRYVQKKAAICFLLFLSLSVSAQDNVWVFDPALDKIYKRVLSLQVDQAYAEIAALKTGNELHKIYVQSFIETVDILITEDEKRFEKVNSEIRNRIDKISNMPETAETLFLKAELNLQRGFNFLNLSQELNAVLAIRQAYQASQECYKKFPGFIPNKKTYGVIQVMVGSVPGKYQWVMNLLGMRGSVKVGQKMLDELRGSKSSLTLEASIIYFAVKGFINQQFDEAAKGFQESLKQNPDSRLLLFLAINALMKDSQSEEALHLIQELDKKPAGLQMILIEYLRGEALVERGDYALAIPAYQKFIKSYKSHSFKKDAAYKIALCHYLTGDREGAVKLLEVARNTGRTNADPDKYAAAMLQDQKLPNAKLLKVRFFIDGGYYQKAKDAVADIQPADLKDPRDKTEFIYRKARLAHKTQDLANARILYRQTIETSGDNPWYFAPNSALQLGYLSQEQGDKKEARKYYEKALSYRRYEYKDGIDSKAKAALESLSTD